MTRGMESNGPSSGDHTTEGSSRSPVILRIPLSSPITHSSIRPTSTVPPPRILSVLDSYNQVEGGSQSTRHRPSRATMPLGGSITPPLTSRTKSTARKSSGGRAPRRNSEMDRQRRAESESSSSFISSDTPSSSSSSSELSPPPRNRRRIASPPRRIDPPPPGLAVGPSRRRTLSTARKSTGGRAPRLTLAARARIERHNREVSWSGSSEPGRENAITRGSGSGNRHQMGSQGPSGDRRTRAARSVTNGVGRDRFGGDHSDLSGDEYVPRHSARRPHPPPAGPATVWQDPLGSHPRDQAERRLRIDPLPQLRQSSQPARRSPTISDDDDFAIIGENITNRVVPRRAAPRAVTDHTGFTDVIQALDRRLAETRAEIEELRRISPPRLVSPERDIMALPNRERPQLGGAVFRAGGQQINYRTITGTNGMDQFGFNYYPRGRQVLPRRGRQPDDAMIEVQQHDAEMRRAMRHIFDGVALDGMADIVGAAIAGGARREHDVQNILSGAELEKFVKPREGFTNDFEMNDIKCGQAELDPIIIDDDGRIVKKNKAEPHLRCINCSSPLLLSSAYASPDDRVFTLQCGHLLDQRCLTLLSIPSTPEQLATVIHYPPPGLGFLEGISGWVRGNKRKTRNNKVTSPKPSEFKWVCPVDGCGEVHVSLRYGGTGEEKVEWKPRDGEGALSVFA